jgi:hypothetical protein
MLLEVLVPASRMCVCVCVCVCIKGEEREREKEREREREIHYIVSFIMESKITYVAQTSKDYRTFLL